MRAIASTRRLALAYVGDQTRQTPILPQWRRPRALRGVKGHSASFPSTEASRNCTALRCDYGGAAHPQTPAHHISSQCCFQSNAIWSGNTSRRIELIVEGKKKPRQQLQIKAGAICKSNCGIRAADSTTQCPIMLLSSTCWGVWGWG